MLTVYRTERLLIDPGGGAGSLCRRCASGDDAQRVVEAGDEVVECGEVSLQHSSAISAVSLWHYLT